ncbi:M13 family peptidase, partial [Acinetobacter baumannii]
YQPIKADLERINTLATPADVLHEAINLRVNGMGSPLFGMNVGPDRKNVMLYIPSIGQGGTSLPDRDYYLKDDARSLKIREAY